MKQRAAGKITIESDLIYKASGESQVLLLCRNVAQQGGHLSYTQQVGGSIPSVPIGYQTIDKQEKSYE